MTRDKLIFPLAIMRILRHFFVSYLESPHFLVMCAIDTTTVRQSEAQLRPKRPWTKTTTPPISSTPSTSTPSSSVGGMTFEAIMAQLQCMDACLDTPSDELCQATTCVGYIARWQARFGGFVKSPSPSPEAFEDEDDDGDSDDDDGDDDEDEDASSSNDDTMTV